jgi:hypothetical protein
MFPEKWPLCRNKPAADQPSKWVILEKMNQFVKSKKGGEFLQKPGKRGEVKDHCGIDQNRSPIIKPMTQQKLFHHAVRLVTVHSDVSKVNQFPFQFSPLFFSGSIPYSGSMHNTRTGKILIHYAITIPQVFSVY